MGFARQILMAALALSPFGYPGFRRWYASKIPILAGGKLWNYETLAERVNPFGCK
jgi:hypothetical protein